MAILDPRWYAATTFGEAVPFDTVREDARLLLVVMTAACEPCRATVDALAEVISNLEDPRVRLILVSDQTEDDLRPAVSRLAATGHPVDVRVIADVARFRAATGITGVPTVILMDEFGRGRAVMLGALEPAGAERLQRLLGTDRVNAADGMSVEYGGPARAIMVNAEVGALEGTGQGDQRTEIEP